jgi:hypothetical protein
MCVLYPENTVIVCLFGFILLFIKDILLILSNVHNSNNFLTN